MNKFEEIFNICMEVLDEVLEPEDSQKVCEEITIKLIENRINCFPCSVGDTVYVVAAYEHWKSNSEYEIIKCVVQRHRFIEDKNDISFSVEGKYKNGERYHANFRKTSIGKKVFCDLDEARRILKIKNKK